MSQPQPDSSRARRHVLLAVKLSVSIILLVVLFSRIDVAQLWATARLASVPWLLVAMAVFAVSTLAGVWRWHLLVKAQHIDLSFQALLGSFLVALYFNNFLPSNIGGDVIRIGDTARAAGSKTRATTVVLMDRGLGLMALVLVAALGDSYAAAVHPLAVPILPVWLWAGFLIGAAVAASSTRTAHALNSAVPDLGSEASIVNTFVATSSGKCSVMNTTPARREVSVRARTSSAPRREVTRTMSPLAIPKRVASSGDRSSDSRGGS